MTLLISRATALRARHEGSGKVNEVRFLRSVPADETPPGEEATIERLLADSAAGMDQSFAQLYDRTSARVYGLVLRVVRDSAQAAEVTQDVYVQIWRESARFDPAEGNAMAWLLMIAHRRAVDRVRASEASRQRDTRYATRQTERSYDQVSEEAQSNMEAQQVLTALDDLTDNQRSVLQLAYFGGYTQREIAELLDIPLGTAKTRIRDGLIRLRDAMGSEGDV